MLGAFAQEKKETIVTAIPYLLAAFVALVVSSVARVLTAPVRMVLRSA